MIPLRMKYERRYVSVTSVFDSTGYMQPKSIAWDANHSFEIDAVTDFRPAGTLDQSRDACYTVRIKGQSRMIYFRRSDPRCPSTVGRWYVLMPSEE